MTTVAALFWSSLASIAVGLVALLVLDKAGHDLEVRFRASRIARIRQDRRRAREEAAVLAFFAQLGSRK